MQANRMAHAYKYTNIQIYQCTKHTHTDINTYTRIQAYKVQLYKYRNYIHTYGHK